MTTPNTTSGTNKNLLDTVSTNDQFSTFKKAVETAGLSDTLRSVGPYTVFAPTNAAFANLPTGKLDSLLQPANKPELLSILNYHFLKGQKNAADIGKWDSARTVHGQSAPIKMVDGKVSIDGANVSLPDIGSSNGMLHGIDKVNIPAETVVPMVTAAAK